MDYIDYNKIFLSICEIANRVPKKLDWDADIEITYKNVKYSTFSNLYLKDKILYIVDRITIDLTNFEYLKYMMIAYQTDVSDKEHYLVKCIHSIFILELLKIFPEFQDFDIVLFYRVYEKVYPFLIKREEIIE